MRCHYIFIIMMMCISDVYSQKDSSWTVVNKWELGFAYSENFTFYYYGNVYYGHFGPYNEWKYGGAKHLRPKHVFSIYCNYRILKFLSTTIDAGFCNHQYYVDDYHTLNYNNYTNEIKFTNYNLKGIDFSTKLVFSIINKEFINPYFVLGVSNKFSFSEKALVYDTMNKYYMNNKWNHYSIKGILGLGINFNIMHYLKCGVEASVITRPFWQSNKILAPTIKHSDISLRFYVGCIIDRKQTKHK